MEIRRAVVVGTGLTAPFLARAFAQAGARVALAGRSEERARAAAADAGCEWAPLSGEGLAGADLVVESVVEDAEVKRELLPRLEAWLSGRAILATNTSGLSIDLLGEGLARPERFAGYHFLTPAHQTAVVEVVAGSRTEQETVDALAAFGRRMGKRPILCRHDVPGFVWNRLQAALLREALHLVESGVADVESIDAAVSDGLAPRWLATGPFAIADLGNIDVWAAVARNVFPSLSTATGAGELGRRAAAGESWYAWTDEARAALVALRAETLAAGQAFAARRREQTPPQA